MSTPRRLAALERQAAITAPMPQRVKTGPAADYDKIGRQLRAVRITHTRPKFDTPADEIERNCRRYAEQLFAFYKCGQPIDHDWIDDMTNAYTDEALSLTEAEYVREWRRYWPARSTPTGAST